MQGNDHQFPEYINKENGEVQPDIYKDNSLTKDQSDYLVKKLIDFYIQDTSNYIKASINDDEEELEEWEVCSKKLKKIINGFKDVLTPNK